MMFKHITYYTILLQYKMINNKSIVLRYYKNEIRIVYFVYVFPRLQKNNHFVNRFSRETDNKIIFDMNK